MSEKNKNNEEKIKEIKKDLKETIDSLKEEVSKQGESAAESIEKTVEDLKKKVKEISNTDGEDTDIKLSIPEFKLNPEQQEKIQTIKEETVSKVNESIDTIKEKAAEFTAAKHNPLGLRPVILPSAPVPLRKDNRRRFPHASPPREWPR